MDYDNDSKVHRLGVMEFRERYENYFNGFIYTFEVTFGAVQDFAKYGITSACEGSCQTCPTVDNGNSGVCLGICNWNNYWDEHGLRCHKCHSTCVDGCEDSNQCIW